MGKVETYQDLEVWKQTRALVSNIYELTKAFPKDEQFGLTNQLRRVAVSIPSNIAEGLAEIILKIQYSSSSFHVAVYMKLKPKS